MRAWVSLGLHASLWAALVSLPCRDSATEQLLADTAVVQTLFRGVRV